LKPFSIEADGAFSMQMKN